MAERIKGILSKLDGEADRKAAAAFPSTYYLGIPLNPENQRELAALAMRTGSTMGEAAALLIANGLRKQASRRRDIEAK